MTSDRLVENTVLKSTDSGHLYRVLWVSPERAEAYIFDMETLDMPFLVARADLQQQMADGSMLVEPNDPYLTIIAEDLLTEKEKKVRDEAWELMRHIATDEPKIFTKNGRGELVSKTANMSGKTRKAIYEYLKVYWKRGKTRGAFVPLYRNRGAAGKERNAGNTKRGRPRKYDDGVGVNVDHTVKEIFEKAVKKYYNTRNENTLQYAYDMMIKDYYTKFVMQPDGKAKAELVSNEIPTIGQFRYWYNKKYIATETIKARKGEVKFNLDHRALLGKSDYGIMGPGAKYQIDATIGDVYLVSRFNRKKIIGRPVLYFVIDVFSRMVTGMYVGLEGPSWAGMMMAIANAVSDKVKYCAEYGIEITEAEWPCRGVPGAILGDRGELEGKAADTLVNALNVRVENAPPYRADMKGIVERLFNTINGTAVTFLPGRVKKEGIARGGDDYRHEAKLDIHQLTKIIIRSVLDHNNYHIFEKFECMAEMVADDVAPIPLDMWNWGISNLSGALRSFPEDAVKLALMPADKASVTARGIKFKGLFYQCERAAAEHWFETARAKGAWKVNISYDPRNMGRIYMRGTDGTVDICRLAAWQDKYEGKCLHEVNYLHEAEKMLKRKNEPKEMASKAELAAAIEDVIAEAEEMAKQTVLPKSKAERIKNIRENRREEKELNRRLETFALSDDEAETTGSPPMPEENLRDDEEQISPTLALIKKMLEARLNE